MAAIDLHYRALTDVARDIRMRRLSPVEVTEVILKRIETVDPNLRSYTTVARELAGAQALTAEREIAAEKYRSPLHGISVAVKDVCFTRGIATTAGMAIHRDFIAGFDATVITRLATAGAVLMGKLHMTEGASFNHHPEMPAPINPWGEELWPGVSSSGSGVATAAGCLSPVWGPIPERRSVFQRCAQPAAHAGRRAPATSTAKGDTDVE